jgi:hypothetical protein
MQHLMQQSDPGEAHEAAERETQNWHFFLSCPKENPEL